MQPHGVKSLTWPSPEDDSFYLADAFSRFLQLRQQQNLPFLAQISFHNCHIPYIGTKIAKQNCANGETCRPPGSKDPLYTEKELDYYSCMNELDKSIGQVLGSLERTGYYDNTMVWFTSDNGPEWNCPPLGICKEAESRPHRPIEGPGSAGPLRGRKRDIYEGGHRVPGIVSFPAVMKGDKAMTSWETVVTMDFLPTIMEVLGVDRPPKQQAWPLDGRSILPLIQDPDNLHWKDTDEGPREIGIGYYDADTTLVHGWGFRYGKWKYVEGSKSCTEDICKKPQLFDLENDLGERRDVSAEHPVVLKTLQNKFWIWHGSVMNSRREESRCKKVRDLPLPASIGETRLEEHPIDTQ